MKLSGMHLRGRFFEGSVRRDVKMLQNLRELIHSDTKQQKMKRLDKVENEVGWLNLMLNQVRDNGQGKYSELERRLTDVEGKSNKGGSE
jgi:hypothetical protein